MNSSAFSKSDIGAQAAWKGFSSQTLYIAHRLISDKGTYEYFPEDIEDLIIKKDNVIVEAVQVKNISADLSLSSLSSTRTSKGGEGFFNRMCSIHDGNSSFSCITIVYFGALGQELQEVKDNNKETKEKLAKRLEEKHKLSAVDATWLINSLKFEKVDLKDLEHSIEQHICTSVAVMSAPLLAKDLLIQYISQLSNNKSHTSFALWQEKIHNIGVSIAAIDGFYKEYNKSLVCLRELQLNNDRDNLQKEFTQGVSVHPTHIRYGLDFKRTYWLQKIQDAIEDKGVAVIKGVSGQGKSALSYRYLLDNYSEGCVFCVRAIASETQAQNLVSALDGLGKHNANLAIYIDVQPGEVSWAFLIQELQARGLGIPVLVSIRDEDYNATPFNGKDVRHEIVELSLSKEEAEWIYDSFTGETPHHFYRTFDEAWTAFGCSGPLIEFVYLLTNSQSLTQRLHAQIEALIKERVSDDWLELLQLVCYAGRLGIDIDFQSAKKATACSTMHAAVQRLKDEYLIRIIDGNRIEALHPVRAQVVFEELCTQTYTTEKDIVFKAIACVPSRSVRIILMEYFSRQQYCLEDIHALSQSVFADWIGFANVLKTMLWLDAKRYVDINHEFIQSLIKKHGKGWLCYLPIDLTGVYRSNELIADGIKDLAMFKDKATLQNTIDEAKVYLTDLSIDYQATDYFLKHCEQPVVLPKSDQDKTSFGYSLFWMAKRSCKVAMKFCVDETVRCISIGELQANADAIRGISEHLELSALYQALINPFIDRMISEMKVIQFSVNEDDVICKFIPPLENEVTLPENIKYSNQYWRIKMLDILQQVYPQKEYIDIELLGIDLLDDLGIEQFDYKLRIPKKNRHNIWVSEVNGWVKIRIDYSLRPSSWEEYVAEIDEIRTNVNDLVEETIKLIDDIYKKGRYTKDRWKRVENRLDIFRKHTFADNHLPISAVDPYCLYTEGNNTVPASEFFTMRQLLSVEKYKNFRKQFGKVYTSLDNFYNQFGDILLARISRKDLEDTKNPRLAMFNLYAAAKDLRNFQYEYDSLFSEYSGLSQSFSQQELENTLTLVNVWRSVLDAPPKGRTIAYEAKQRYRKGSTLFSDLIAKIPDITGGMLFETEHCIYIVSECNIDEEKSLQSEYTRLVLTLRALFRAAILESSDRWYCETQPMKLAYIPIIAGACSSGAFSIPLYILLDTAPSHIAKSMLPYEIETSVREKLFVGTEIGIWITALQKVQEIKLYLKRFSQILRVAPGEKCIQILNVFAEETKSTIKNLWDDLSTCEHLVSQLIANGVGETFEIANAVKDFLACRDEILKYISDLRDTSDIVQLINTISGVMLLLQSAVMQMSDNRQ